MELRLVVEAAGHDPADVMVELDPGTPAQRLLDELAMHLGRPPGEYGAAQSERTGTWIGGDDAVGECGLCDGDRLTLAREPAEAAGIPAEDGALVELVVVSGPASGARIPLGAGTHVVGRGPGADVVLDDRAMSRRHFSAEVSAAGVTVADAGSSNGTFVHGRAVEEARAVGNGDILEAGRTQISFAPCEPAAATALVDAAGHIPFNRPPRVVRRTAPGRIDVPAPPATRERGRLSLGPMLLPLVMGIGMFALTRSPIMLMIAALTPALAVWTHLEGRRSGRRDERDAGARFESAVSEAERTLSERRREERARRSAAAPDAAELMRRTAELRHDLWERRRDDEDFLALRVGTADQPSEVAAVMAPGGEDGRREEAERRLDADRMLTGLPVTVPLASGFAGLAGEAAAVDALARWLVAQAAALHSPADLRIAAAIGPGRLAAWDWLKWLPHVEPEATADDPVAAHALLAAPANDDRATLLVLDGRLRLDRALVDGLTPHGLAVIWLGDEPRTLPGACTHVLELASGVARLRLVEVREGDELDDVNADGVPQAYAEELARRLAPVRDAAAQVRGGGLPTRASLLDLLELPDPEGAALEERWQAADLRLSAPIGMAADGPFAIEVGGVEGLRMLVAGMPGAGKSELLQTFIASLAAGHGPDRVTFLLVDYKGGAAFRDCVALPHTVGILTDLDPHLAERCRMSLLAELRRREGLLKEVGARSLRELARRDPGRTPPSLVIVVDEFATLVREVPAFVETAVDVAQRGRSLGLHLVLATQRPRGAVSDAIRANTNIRVAMRVSDAGESRDVIEAPDAASIPPRLPGRAIVVSGRTAGGAPELTEVQTAYAGGRSAGILGGRATVVVSELRFGVAPEPRERVLSTTGGSSMTDLQALVAAAEQAARRLDLPDPPAPWLPPLPSVVELETLGPVAPAQAAIGLLDDPERQRQAVHVFDLARDGSLLVFGASGSGKTSLLCTVAASLAAGASPAELQLYGLDFASRALRQLEALPHCGAIVAGDDEERVQRLLGGLQRALAERRQRVADGGDLAGLPRVVLLLDGYAGFAAAFERVQFGEATQALTRLAAEGRPLGIGVVVTADRRADVPGALAGVVPARVVLRMADADDYATLGVPRHAVEGAPPPPGRGWLRDGLELQVGRVTPERLAALGEELRDAHAGQTAPAIGRMPSRLGRDRMPVPAARWTAILGVEGELLGPASLDLATGSALVAGPRRSGRSTALATIAGSLARGPDPVPMHLLAPRRSPLTGLPVWASAAAGLEACRDAVAALAVAAAPFVVVIDDAEELGEDAAAAALGDILRRARDEDVRILAAAESRALQRLFGGWLRDLRGEGHGLLLQPDGDADGDLLGVRLDRRAVGPMPPGRGFMVAHGVARLVQTAGDGA